MAASTAVTLEDTPPNRTPATRGAQVAALTGLRGFAAMMVVVIHVSGRTDYEWLGITDLGVLILFVLSGYLLYRPWGRWGMQVAARPSLRQFTRRRLARIFPAFLVVAMVVTLLDPPSRPGTPGGWVRLLTLTWIYEPGQLPVALLHTWSLATELSWYVAVPVLLGGAAVVARTRSPKVGFWLTTALLAAAFPVTAAWRWWVHAEDLTIYFTYSFWLPGFLAAFACGALVAHLAEGRRAGLVSMGGLGRVAADPWTLLVAALALTLLGTSSLGGPAGFAPRTFAEEQLSFACATLAATILLVGIVFGEPSSPLSRFMGATWLVATGRWSYSIYLWHLPLIVILEADVAYPTGLHGLAYRLALLLALTLPLSAATYAWVERPAIRWSQGLTPFGADPDPGTSTTPPAGADQDRPPAADLPRDGRSPTTASSSTNPQPMAPAPAQSRRVSAEE
ncbi:Peptidoglycan/LPS O-acetylase OafA/YrhL, contains acyltransferase and SGNH-hydrolase domains [Nocardioides szechwanensis]|uniref:Peptidoglycan/LPS O-acetylase OafA/YrhL, contains acyltransferase and SGNH-hydrolase domains n=1 Tax=Nocardioides szechwanensis TaxID=1005944 RepID=A0A1G9VQZ6_9ACTN|nr:acyltransferase [Nocardioides szechwanensis]SDM74546.1 Peptidoglycan/LPS O-acetylase OafA/YrhL, contains acyltransferase and SGNH-hydrolase domains [Nocardioides szechwanensis]